MRFTEQFITEALPHLVLYNSTMPDNISISVDTRTLQPGDVFVALEGNNVDGHNFLDQALAKGAQGLLIAEHKRELLQSLDQNKLKTMLVMIAEKPREALIALATAWRKQFLYPVIGITGSAGKTSTKELLAHIIRVSGKSCLASLGNQNTLIGAAINIFKMRSDYDYAIFEMGISKRGEMAMLADLVQPTTALVTNIGHAHMEGLGGVSDIAFEKRQIFSRFKNDNVGIVNGDQPLLANVSYPHPLIKFGSKTTNQIQARKVKVTATSIQFILKIYGVKYAITLPTTHLGVLNNTLAATAMAYYIGIPTEAILKAIPTPQQVEGRFEQRILKNGSLIVHDAYNANPEVMKTSLLAFHALPTKNKKIAVLGDMKELGSEGPFWHSQIGRFLRKTSSVRHVIFVGSLFNNVKKSIPINITVDYVATWQEAYQMLNQMLDEQPAIFVKGSRAIGLDHLIDAMQ